MDERKPVDVTTPAANTTCPLCGKPFSRGDAIIVLEVSPETKRPTIAHTPCVRERQAPSA